MQRMLRLGLALGVIVAAPLVGRAEELPYEDIHKYNPPYENTHWPRKTKERAKAALEWPGPLGEQVGETGESTKGQTRDEKRAKTSPREMPKQPY